MFAGVTSLSKVMTSSCGYMPVVYQNVFSDPSITLLAGWRVSTHVVDVTDAPESAETRFDMVNVKDE